MTAMREVDRRRVTYTITSSELDDHGAIVRVERVYGAVLTHESDGAVAVVIDHGRGVSSSHAGKIHTGSVTQIRESGRLRRQASLHDVLVVRQQ